MSDERRAKDQRQWMRFPIDMHRDPKVTRLTDAQFRVFFEMNGEARLEGNDGVFGKDDAEFRWPVDHLAALVRSHPTEPLVLLVNDTYVLRRYAHHQFTEADRAELKAKRAEAGAKGGKQRASNAQASAKQTEATGKHLLSKVKQTQAESESETETDTSKTSSVSQEGNRARNAGLTDQGIVSIIKTVELHCDLDVTADEAADYATYIAAKSERPVQHPAAYARNAIENSPLEAGTWFTKHRRHLKAVGNG